PTSAPAFPYTTLFRSKVAEALRAEKLILLTDVEGVKGRDGTLLDTLAADVAADFLRDGTIAGGMIPKVECCLEAIRGGVRQAHVDRKSTRLNSSHSQI